MTFYCLLVQKGIGFIITEGYIKRALSNNPKTPLKENMEVIFYLVAQLR